MRGRRVFVLAPLVLLATGVLAACQLLVGVTDPESVPRSAEARPDGAAEDPCVKRGPPAPPAQVPVPLDAGSRDYVFAVRRLVGQAPQSYDLDGRCTGIEGSTTADPPCTTVGPPIVDDPGGGDNALGVGIKRLLLQGSADPFGERATQTTANGKLTSLIGLFQYSGLADDPEVRVQVVPSAGIESTGCPGDDAGAQDGIPRWDGCDRWTHTPGAIQGTFWSATQPGYVVGDVLVFKASDEFEVALLAGKALMRDAVLTARIVRDASGVVVGLTDGILAGRFALRDVIPAFYGFEALGTTLCKSQLLHDSLVDTVCGSRDVPLRRSDDGKGLACDAVTFAAGFDAYVVKLGSERALPAPDCDGGVLLTTTCPD